MKTVQKVKEGMKDEIISGNDTKPNESQYLYSMRLNIILDRNKIGSSASLNSLPEVLYL
jgi:hypothetical protein